MRIRQAFASGALGTALVIGIAAPPASAADGWQRTTPTSGSCAPYFWQLWVGSGCFEPHGEYVWVMDDHADGDPVGVKWQYSPPGSNAVTRSGVIYNDHGKDAGWTKVNKSFDEGGKFKFQVCAVNLESNPKTTYDCSTALSPTT